MFRTAVAVAFAVSTSTLVFGAPAAHAAPADLVLQGQGHHGPPPAHGKPAQPGKSGAAHKSAGAQGKITPAQHLQRSPQLAQRLAGLLPAGTNVPDAAAGFKNLGQFVAAVHVSHNLSIPFDQLKDLMAGAQHESLGKAVKTLRPDASKDAVKQAEAEAKKDIDETKTR